MGRILRAPASLAKAASFVETMTRAFFTDNYNTLRTEINFWHPPDIYTPPGAIPEEGVWQSYQSIIRVGMLDKLATKSSEFAAAINAYRNSYFLLKSRVFNKTLLEDLLRGQEFPPPIQEFVIYTETASISGFDNWISYRNRMIDEAQARINQYSGSF